MTDEHMKPLAGRRVCCLIRSETPAHNSRLIKVAESLADAGATVTIVYAGLPGATPPVGKFDVVRVESRYSASEHPARFVRVATNLWRELVMANWRMTAAAVRANSDTYHAHFLPTLLPAIVAARLRGARVVYDTRDLFIDAARAQWPGWRTRFYQWLERRLIGRADLVLAVSRPMGAVYQERYGIATPLLVMNGPYECLEAAADTVVPVRLFFQGAFRHNRNLDTLIRAMGSLRGRATLTLQGWGDLEADLRSLVRGLGLTDTVFFRDRCDPKDVVACAAEYDVGVICYRADTLNLSTTVPNKLLDYVGAGLAVAASDLPGHRSVLEGTDFGVLIDPGCVETLARDLGNLVDDPERVALMKRAASMACPALRWDAQARTLIEAYMRLGES